MTVRQKLYPSSDEVSYLEWFRPNYTSVFIALNPFLRLAGGPPLSHGTWIPEEVTRTTKIIGSSSGVTWVEMAQLCEFDSIIHVNQALGKTWSQRLADKYASQNRTDLLLQHCKANSIYPPDEGCPSPLFELSTGMFLKALGHEVVTLGDGFGQSPERIAPDQLLDTEKVTEFGEIFTDDRSTG